MRLRASMIGQFCVAVTMVMGLSAADAAVQTQTETLNPTQPAFGPGVPNNPLLFNKFDTTQGTLTSVTLDMSYTSNRNVTITFTGPSSASVTTSSLSNPSQGGSISIGDPGATTSAAGTLLSAALPVLKFTATGGSSGQTLVFSTIPSPGTLPLQAFNTAGAPVSSNQTGSATATLTGTQLAMFTGTGQIGLPVFATNPMTQTATDQTAKATIQTLDGVSVTLTYNYTPNPVPEPSSVALLGLGGGGLLLARRFRRRAASAGSPTA